MGDRAINDTKDQAFERQALTYEQNFEQFRDLNRLMWQVPILAITITGGFWYAVLAIPTAAGMAKGLFLMCGILDLALIFVLVRIRYVMSQYLVKLKEFHPDGYVEAKGTCFYNRSHVVVFSFSISLLVAAALSIGSFVDPDLLRNWP